MSIQAQVLQLIRQRRHISQSEIRFLTGLSASAISGAVKRAHYAGLVHEVGAVQEALGRPRVLLGLNAGYGYAVGVQLNAQRNHVVLTDLRGEVLVRRELHHPKLVPEQVAADVAAFVAGLREGPVIGIGLAVSGIIDAERGVCLDSTTTVGWHDVPIGPLVERATGIPTRVENDANALALAELLFGAGQGQRSFVVLTVGKGVGAGIVIDGKLYRGRNGIAGEIGHISVAPASGFECYCGKTDCLEAVASAEAISRQLGARLGRPVPLPELRAALSEHPELAREVLSQAAQRLGAALATLATIFDPDAIFIAPEPFLDAAPFAPAVRSSFERHLLPVSRVPTTLHFLDESADRWARGAASIAVDQFFEVVARELASSPPASFPSGGVGARPP